MNRLLLNNDAIYEIKTYNMDGADIVIDFVSITRDEIIENFTREGLLVFSFAVDEDIYAKFENFEICSIIESVRDKTYSVRLTPVNIEAERLIHLQDENEKLHDAIIQMKFESLNQHI